MNSETNRVDAAATTWKVTSRIGNDMHDDATAARVACTPVKLVPDWPVQTWRSKPRPPNLIVVMLDPLSDARFQTALPATREALRDLGFASFPRYGVVGAVLAR